ncbi:hypothetical protein E5206_17880 [Arthrobacter sp. PAMC25564]|uniref:hypothetical protein n=1 Tax=Arthrobacter sp. PAMC25564 TaxID=2565366 RepID=UPI0010A21D80|nr:hypothetical protein [Arthrobacter sp. PAMC25564]QCB98544.1 hypothetical protein E5206_17880 [Arthrobacter sp. PAMC25564]
MELFVALLAGIVMVSGGATFRAVLRDGHGHIPEVRSNASWTAGDLPSEPYAVSPNRIPTALWFR